LGTALVSHSSSWPLKTATGILRGTYQMVSEGGLHFDIEIAPFTLREPYTVH
jgi:ApaG protein